MKFIPSDLKDLENDTIMYYQLGKYFHQDYYDGIKFNVEWKNPGNTVIMNERDKNYELL